MTFTELTSPDELTDFINANPVCIVTFSATWCGPCKRSKPELQVLAQESPVPFGYVYESDLTQDDNDDYLTMFSSIFCKASITAFPTYICFKDGGEVQRINGSNFPDIQEMIHTHVIIS
jgi:thiol-disulfide isomerase/thioredoxin